ncbi:hypothetical protein BSKO_06577 [Bryopsis sp. KO-2023]|nr:hypothetical protein BSKO_06577 [Bryopsis sp. KO-2023]
MGSGGNPSCSSQVQQATPFLMKTYQMVDDPLTDDALCWNDDGSGFIVKKTDEFAKMLPTYFKHSNFSSFVRQLNTYGFRKVHPDRWEFANENFKRGKKELLNLIHRRKPTSQTNQPPNGAALLSSTTAIEIGQYGLKDEVAELKRDKEYLARELVYVRQKQQWSEQQIQQLNKRLEGAENRQMEMMHLFTKFLQNPRLLSQMFSVANRQRLEGASGKRKRRAREGDGDVEMTDSAEDNQIVSYHAHQDAGFADLLPLLGNLAYDAAVRSPRNNHTEVGPEIREGQFASPLRERNDASSSSQDSGVKPVALGIPAPTDMNTGNFVNHPHTSQPLGAFPPYELDNLNQQEPAISPTTPPILSPFVMDNAIDPQAGNSIENSVDLENYLNPPIDELIRGFDSTDLMMANQSLDSLQRDDSFLRSIFAEPIEKASNNHGGEEGVRLETETGS